MYVKNVRRWLVPFLQRCEHQEPGSFKSLIRDYMINVAQGDLDRCLKLFQTSKADVSNLQKIEENLFEINSKSAIQKVLFFGVFPAT